jgi:uncharacterized protein
LSIEKIIFIGLIFCFGFGIESIFGFAGTIISLAILSFFFEIKEIIVLGIFAGGLASTFIFLSGRKFFDIKIYKKIILFGIPGLILGTFLLKNFSSKIILYIFAGFLIVFSIWTIWSPKFCIPKILKPVINFIGGIFGGIFGTPGPFFILTMKDAFGDKSKMRTTLAAVFLTLNILRIPLYVRDEILNFEKVAPFWWVIFPLLFVIWLGHKIHLKISERVFQIGVSVLLGVAGISFLF